MLYRTLEERAEWLKFAFSYHKIRPSLHLISKITGALFFIMLAGTSEHLASFYDNYPRFMNILVAILSFKAADYLEDKVSRAISNFAFAVSRWKQSKAHKGIAIGAVLVLVPVLTISAVTSFSGIQGNISKGDLGLDKASATLAKINKENKGELQPEKSVKEYLEQRKELRANIEANQKSAIETAKKECAKYYSTKSEKADCMAEKEADINAVYLAKLDSFDLVTGYTMEVKGEAVTAATEKQQKERDKLVSLLYSQLDHKNGQIQWVAGIVGWGAMFFEAFALIAALLVHFVCYQCKADEEEMIKVGLSSEPSKKGVLNGTVEFVKGFLWGSRP